MISARMEQNKGGGSKKFQYGIIQHRLFDCVWWQATGQGVSLVPTMTTVFLKIGKQNELPQNWYDSILQNWRKLISRTKPATRFDPLFHDFRTLPKGIVGNRVAGLILRNAKEFWGRPPSVVAPTNQQKHGFSHFFDEIKDFPPNLRFPPDFYL